MLMRDDKVNMCNSRGPMSVCQQSTSLTNQQQCKHYEKATRLNHCMYFRFDEFCDSLKAQKDLQLLSDKITKFLEQNQKKIEEAKLIEAEESQIGKTKQNY